MIKSLKLKNKTQKFTTNYIFFIIYISYSTQILLRYYFYNYFLPATFCNRSIALLNEIYHAAADKKLEVNEA